MAMRDPSSCPHRLVAAVAGLLCLVTLLIHADGSSYQLTEPAAVPRRTILPASFHEHVSRTQRLRPPIAPPPLIASLDAAVLPPVSLFPSWACSPGGGGALVTEDVASSLQGVSPPNSRSPRVFHVTDYGADPTGRNDSSDAISRAVADAFQAPSPGRTLLAGIPNLGGAEVHLDGGIYLVSRPIRLPSTGGGNIKIHGGSLVATNDFPADGYLIELRSTAASGRVAGPSDGLHYEYFTLRDLMLDANFRGGGIAVIDSLRTTIHNCYIVHFTTEGVLVRRGHETFISNSYVGQHITSGADPGERNFTGVGIHLDGNDNAVTDVVIFSAATGILVSGQANTLTGVHCYNKATGWGGVGIYLRLPGLTQTRVLNCYLDYTGIVAEDPVQLLVAGCFFLGDARVVLKSVKGVMQGVTIVDNMFSGGGGGLAIVELDQSGTAFAAPDQVVVERNVVRGMAPRATSAKGSSRGNGTSWTVDFAPVLLFPDRIDHVEYALRMDDGAKAAAVFAGHALRSVAGNKVVVESQVAVPATVHVAVAQCELLVTG
ncbi:hypothetical protein Taro_016149 [Colocasia esculenta]|uniref:Rhamnogalacturonase A/B/Epimerase-like pectate lyase domain-containing protein n=1 Tax=Colocasia esculenta TaxID=4460 RepID=A0A843UN25_COLES|nr:hypothetical protein [Colocasia esculenta]